MEQKIKILIADENAEFRANLKSNLTHNNMEIVDETSNGLDVLTKIMGCTWQDYVPQTYKNSV